MSSVVWVDGEYVGNFSNPMGEYLYNTYAGGGPQWAILAPPLIFFTLMWIGYFGNGLIVYATIINKKLHGSYNYLVSLSCLGDIMHQSCHWIYLINVASGHLFIPYDSCFYGQAFFQTGASLSIFATFFVGVDRFISVNMPTTYRRLSLLYYLGAMFLIATLFAIYVLYLSWAQTKTIYGREPVMCVIIDSLGGDAAATWFNMCVVLNVLDVVIYGAVWATLKLKTGASSSLKRVFKSLLVMMIMVVVGWMLNAFVRSILLPYGNIPVSEWFFWASYFGMCANIASSSNVFILYTFSSEYRATFRQVLAPVFPCLARADQGKVFFNTPSAVTGSSTPAPSKTPTKSAL